MSFYSRAYQLVLCSDFDTGFPEIQQAATDVEIRSHSQFLGNPERLAWTGSGDELTFHIDDIASYVVRGGRSIDVFRQPDVATWDVSYYLQGPAMAGILAQRGCVPLHASVIDTPEGAVLISSCAGGGKSTVAAALRQRGFPILSDEMAVIRITAQGLELIPDSPSVQLSSASVRHLGGYPESLVPVRPHLHRYRLWLPKPGTETPVSRPVRAVIFLRLDRHADHAELEPLDAVSALMRVTHRLYRWRALLKVGDPYGGPHGQRQAALEALAGRVDRYQLVCPPGLQHLDEAVAEIVSMLRSPRPKPTHWTQRVRLPKIELVERWGPEHRVFPLAKPGFVALASFPKSGNTWVRALLTAWHDPYQDDTDISHFEGGAQMLDCHTFEEELGIKASYIQSLDELASLRARFHRQLFQYLAGPMAIKLHESSTRCADGSLLFPPDIMVGVVLIVRNPLDVAPSYANHFGLSLEQAVKALNHEQSWSHIPDLGESADRLLHLMGSWTSHTLSWLDDPEHRVLLVRYEDLLVDPLAELRRIVVFSGEIWDEARGREVVDFCRFERLKAHEEEHGFKERPRGSAGFFHKGKSGGWRESLAPELSRQICLDHGPLMRRLGYAAEVEEVLGVSDGATS